MIERLRRGEVPAKHHIAFRTPDGDGLYYEECFTRRGFDGPYTIMYHQRRPHEQRLAPGLVRGWPAPRQAPADAERALAKRHYKSQELAPTAGAPVDARVPLLFNRDVVLSVLKPDRADDVYWINGDADDLYYIHRGGGVLHSLLGELRFEERDYVYVPKGLLHRLAPDEGRDQHWLSIECLGGMGLLSQWRNEVGQLTMDAPYCHRDFRAPEFVGPVDEGIRELVVKREHRFHGYRYADSPLDVVGWDGACYPFVFPILAFQPRAGLVHLPPTWHGTFSARGALICSFVPRALDFHPEAIPCPYPHHSVDCDEFLFYCHGNFSSRRGIDAGSVSHHPYGLPHGPHPGAYEGSVGVRSTDELAVMVDTFEPLHATAAALAVEDAGYHDSFIA
ncbi:homogentisate 1,2-dioxygenase [Haliangium sp.]|uniref:homogentisate 1,2-dioxygenase n=1 Tax=Haliangium sp. TaxID=2663208 RepID=UPI003D0FAC57